ncbi:TPA: hypothetical protein U1269_000983 [Streptococcus suis]|nr:hypothetical protein [Streptococcus suis]
MMKVAKEFPNWATLPNLSDNALYLIAKELPNFETLRNLETPLDVWNSLVG